MQPRNISPILILSPRKLVPMILILAGLVSSCGKVPALSPTQSVLDGTPIQTSAPDTLELLGSDRLGLCFSYPKGFTQIPYNDTVEIVAPDLPNSDQKGLFWLEISDSYDRTVEEIADQEMTYAAGLRFDRWTVTLGGEPAVVLDGMPGQDLQRRMYAVHQQTLY
ncbi:MAG: hypothetical protein WCF08_01725, partial [Anaerolineaceae bacterium]